MHEKRDLEPEPHVDADIDGHGDLRAAALSHELLVMYHGHGRVQQHQHVHPYHPLPGSMQLAQVQTQVALLAGVP